MFDFDLARFDGIEDQRNAQLDLLIADLDRTAAFIDDCERVLPAQIERHLTADGCLQTFEGVLDVLTESGDADLARVRALAALLLSNPEEFGRQLRAQVFERAETELLQRWSRTGEIPS